MFKTGIGEDSHRFESKDSSKPCILGGVLFKDCPGFMANSDGDVIFHAICNVITSLSGVLVLGGIADDLCVKDGITDSSAYLKEALNTLQGWSIVHVACSVEGKRPKLKPEIPQMRSQIAHFLNIEIDQVGVTATSGEGLSDCGCGDGVRATAIVTVQKQG